jgi:hypothetical protein
MTAVRCPTRCYGGCGEANAPVGGVLRHRWRMLDTIESVWKSVNAKRRAIAEIHEVIARADEILVRGHGHYRHNPSNRWPATRV